MSKYRKFNTEIGTVSVFGTMSKYRSILDILPEPDSCQGPAVLSVALGTVFGTVLTKIPISVRYSVRYLSSYKKCVKKKIETIW